MPVPAVANLRSREQQAAQSTLIGWALILAAQTCLLTVVNVTALSKSTRLLPASLLVASAVAALLVAANARRAPVSRLYGVLAVCMAVVLADTVLLLAAAPSLDGASWTVVIVLTTAPVVRPTRLAIALMLVTTAACLGILATWSNASFVARFNVASALIVSVLVGLALARARERYQRTAVHLVEQLQRMATTDSLTGLANRRAWEQAATLQLSRARRLGSPIAIALGDLDLFKAYNDSHGHAAGDALLCRFAEQARAVARSNDLIGRWGGEEFVFAFPECTADSALAIILRIQSVIPSGQSASFGVVTWDGIESLDECLRRADQAMYNAKDRGRARTVVS